MVVPIACHSSKKMTKKGVGSGVHNGSPSFFVHFYLVSFSC